MWTKEQRDAQAAKVRSILKVLRDYYIKNNLDPAKNWFKDPIHGAFITKWTYRLWKERDRIQTQMGEMKFQHILTRKKQIQMAKKEKETKKKKVVVKEEKKEETKKKVARTSKYDYPLVDGKEMNAAQKKKYRAEQRKLKEEAEGGKVSKKKASKPKVSKKDSKPKAKKKEEVATSSKPTKVKKDKAKKKHHHKEED